MKISTKIILVTIVEIIVVVYALLYWVRDPLPLSVIAIVGWPFLIMTVVMFDSRFKNRGSNMIELQNYQNLSRMRQDLDKIAKN